MPERSPRKVFILLTVAIVSGAVGFGLIKVVWGISYMEDRLSVEDGSEEKREPEESSPREDLEHGWSSYRGIVQVARDGPERVTHVLADENGEEIIFLMTDDQKLVVSEALEVEVQGPMINLKDAVKPVMQVERVVFK